MNGTKLAIAAALTSISLTISAQEEWRNPQVNQINRLEQHADYFAFSSADDAKNGDKTLAASYLSIEGQWKFNWVENADQRPTTFFQTNFDDSQWGTMPVPGLWELNGYGAPVYTNVGFPWGPFSGNNAPEVGTAHNHVGSYRRTIAIPDNWTGQNVVIHIGSATSNVYLWINGKFVGYSEDSKVATEFDITKYLKKGDNLFAMQIFRWCDGSYFEDQDFWRFAGIARECYLYSRPKVHIDDVEIIPDLTDNYTNGALDITVKTSGSAKVKATLFDNADNQIFSANLQPKGKNTFALLQKCGEVKKWSAEEPNLYSLEITILDNKNTVLQVIRQNVGFRKIEQKTDLGQIWVNGKPVLIKGVDRHELDPDYGYCVPRWRMEQDAKIMKEMNVNAVRTCHYPDDPYWYELCDRYGFYMVSEANLESHGLIYTDRCLSHNETWLQAHLERNQRAFETYKNHPAIIFLSLGNEAGPGKNFEACYKWLKERQSSRPVQYEPAGLKEFTDVFCPMYADYGTMERYANDPKAYRPLIQCEYSHAMGNSCGGFKEYWDLIRKYPKLQGGFIWDFVDQALHRRRADGTIEYTYGGDYNNYDATDNNFNCNGLISPDRVLNPHAYEVKYFYQNIWTELVDIKQGTIKITNENFFTDLSKYYAEWSIEADGKCILAGIVPDIKVEPQSSATVQLGFDGSRIPAQGDVFFNIKYKLKQADGILPAGSQVAYDQLVIAEAELKDAFAKSKKAFTVDFSSPKTIVKGENFEYQFDESYFLCSIVIDGRQYLKDGSTLRPNFWRAPTDNDYGARMERRFAAWENASFKLKNRERYYADKDKITTVVAEYQVIASDTIQLGELALTYRINDKGQIAVHQQFTPNNDVKAKPNLFRFGMRLEMPETFDRIDYFGRGPVENYADRKLSQPIGHFAQSVEEQYYPYIRPQETGTKSDLRRYAITDVAGRGLQFTSTKLFSASALPYTMENLCPTKEKRQYHTTDLKAEHLTAVCIDGAQMGMGCVNSWGAWPLPQYCLPFGPYEFEFVITPVK